ncbi:hypothetical protein SAMN02745166_00910 [Prosthecobacter debontii]|uniref:Uncharacterized protein n=1 Tax=Prosthecobacter debontii TaxID=48467 RepID=A0A1T4WZ63_9BACT|nr:hypothetical protein [Prosthecobacter debontii]SKA82447.1 hypothetical protein SAMN02745166_00910 [Prosthecobacter debontii]
MNLHHRQRRFGFAAMPLVTAMSMMLVFSLLMLFKQTLMNRDQASDTQLRVDYQQREEALLRAMVVVFPNKAIACLKANLAEGDSYAWRDIFRESVTLSSASDRMTPELVAALGLAGKRSANVGDHEAGEVQSWITSLEGVADEVTPGTTAFAPLFAQPAFAGKVPPLLEASAALQAADALRPIISDQKRYSSQDAGLLADILKYPTFNLIPYPNIRFGYAKPGQPFVAKRNWWAFTVNYGNRESSISRHYILSLYEVPSQMPIEAATFAAIGQHQDGTAWNAATVSIQGSVYADQMRVDGDDAFGAERLAGKSGIDLTRDLQLGGITIGADFDELGERERLQAEQESDVLPVALSANSGRLTFLPLPTGSNYLRRAAAGVTLNAWDDYLAGAERCQITVEATDMVSYEDQTPTAIRVRFQGTAGGVVEVNLTRGSNWPTYFEPGGPEMPFQTELTNNSRSCLTFHPAHLKQWLLGQGGASVDVNRSLYFGVDTSLNPLKVRALSDPPAAEDMCVIIRKGKDLSDYTAGISVVGPLRVYVGDDLNAVSLASAPVGSGLDAAATFYPALSIFASELRVGTTGFNRPIDHRGQLGSLATGGTATPWQPLDMKSGSDDAVHTDSISAELAPLRSPAELPPIHTMNWLVVIEEIPQE